MTEGVEAPQPQSVGFKTHPVRGKSDSNKQHKGWNCPPPPSGTRPGPKERNDWELKSSSKPVEKDEKEEEEEEEEKEDPRAGAGAVGRQIAPDGGWGWVVLAATVLVLALTVAFPSCIGIFYTELQNEFQASNTETSWVPAIMTAVLHAGGPLCSILVERCGCRATIMMGGILSGLGMVVSSFARTMLDLYIGAGIITGLGFCLCFQSSIAMVGHYFVRRRAFANALSSTGTALGLSTLPLLANFLLARFGWRGSFLVLGGVLLHCCACGAVMRPPGAQTKAETMASEPQTQSNRDCIREGGLKARLLRTRAILKRFLRRHLAFDLLHSHPRFCALALGVTWMMLGFVVPLVYLVPHATAQGLGQDAAALLMAILGLVNVSARPVAALVFGLPRFRRSQHFVYLFAGALLVNGLSNCLCGLAIGFKALLAYVLVFGASMSVVGSLLFTVLMETVEMSRFPSALGLISIMESISLLIGPPLAGALADSTGHYSYVFFACSASVSTAALFIMGSFYWLDRQSYVEEKKNNPCENGRVIKPNIMITTDQIPFLNITAQQTDRVTDV